MKFVCGRVDNIVGKRGNGENGENSSSLSVFNECLRQSRSNLG